MEGRPVCAHCEKSLANKSSLLRHQKTSKACLRIQGKLQAKLDDQKKPREPRRTSRKRSDPCPGCSKIFARIQNLAAHVEVCPLYKEEKSFDKRLEVALKELEARLKAEHEVELGRLRNELAAEQFRHETSVESLREQLAEERFRRETSVESLRQQIAKEEIAHGITKGQLDIQTETVHKAVTAPRTTTIVNHNTNNTTNNNLFIASLTPELGEQLAGRIGYEHFWEGQTGIARELRCLRDSAGNKHFRVKDENRGKFEINVSGNIERDDKAVKIIKTVKKPVVDRIGDIKDELIQKAGTEEFGTGERLDTIIRAYDQCIAFKEPKRNRKFILELAGNS